MKKSIFVIALLASLLASANTDSYLYWMVNVDEGQWNYPYSVQISGLSNGEVGTVATPLTIYDFEGSIGTSIGRDNLKAYKDNAFGLYTLLGSEYSSYVIELLSSSNEIVGSHEFDEVMVSDYIARSGMGDPKLGMYMPTIVLQAPEPSSGLLLLLGVAGLALRRRKQIAA